MVENIQKRTIRLDGIVRDMGIPACKSRDVPHQKTEVNVIGELKGYDIGKPHIVKNVRR
jgi:hypothetical protein